MTPLALKKNYGIALTGGIATGKSTVAKILREAGFVVLDADLLARDAVAVGSSGLAKIIDAFGQSFLLADGSLDRKKLGLEVFANPAQLKVLESITHPAIAALLDQELEKQGLLSSPQPWFYEAALIFEGTLQLRFHQVWATYCPEHVQISRLMARDGIDETQARTILNKQMPSITKKILADHWIDTAGTPEEIRDQVSALINRLFIT